MKNEKYLWGLVIFFIILVLCGLVDMIMSIGWYSIPVILFFIAWCYVENLIRKGK